jgi:hypothetical protein
MPAFLLEGCLKIRQTGDPTAAGSSAGCWGLHRGATGHFPPLASSSDENLKVAVVLGMRTFNAFAASIKLALSGYHQNSALILRDVMETVFLLDLFAGDPSLIERWRHADKKGAHEGFFSGESTRGT